MTEYTEYAELVRRQAARLAMLCRESAILAGELQADVQRAIEDDRRTIAELNALGEPPVVAKPEAPERAA